MNSIAKKLIDESYDYDDTSDGAGAAMYGMPPTLSPEYLVRLVAQECIKVCKENNAFVAADRIKKHFGV